MGRLCCVATNPSCPSTPPPSTDAILLLLKLSVALMLLLLKLPPRLAVLEAATSSVCVAQGGHRPEGWAPGAAVAPVAPAVARGDPGRLSGRPFMGR